MRLRSASGVALFVAVTMIASAVQICIPTVASDDGTTAGGQMLCGQEKSIYSSPLFDLHVADVSRVCCKSVEPLVLTKLHSLSAPVRDVLHWMTPAVRSATTIIPAIYFTATASPTPPDSVVGGNPPRYVVNRAFLI